MAEFDIAVIGGGPAGYVGAIKAAQLGAKTVLIEKDQIGGTCLNRGCIPTKALLKTAELVHEIAGASKRGITTGAVEIDMPAVIKEKNRVVKKLTGGVASLLAANGVELIRGEGTLLPGGPSGLFNIAVPGQNGVTARAVLLAGGSRTARLPIPGLDLPGVLGSTEILDLETIPKRLAIIGGGVIGIEMAMIFQSFGSRISIIEAMPRILPFMDGETSALIHKILAARGAELVSGLGLSKIEKEGEELKLFLADGRTLAADTVLVSIGRTGDLSCAGEGGVKTEKGKVLVNDYMETSIPGVFAPGDINGKKMLAHAAFKMAETAAENALSRMAGSGGGMKKAGLDYVPSVVYCFPEVAAVGLTQEEAEKTGPVAVGKFPLGANGKALAAGQGEGFVKVLSDEKYGKILGVHMAGPGASEIINEAAALMSMEITVHELAGII
ncbi:MAG: dihydrolipoyl dehydrogenase, partial [Treponema sp.]|nr:dihydrolipoyl dehydrogenase [Treponema sp.]